MVMEEILSACQDACNGNSFFIGHYHISPPVLLFIFSTFTMEWRKTRIMIPSNGSWDNAAYRESFAQRCFKVINEYGPGFCSSIIGYDMLTPPDLEREFGLTGIIIITNSKSMTRDAFATCQKEKGVT